MPESSFSQDNQGLAQRKLRKQKFEAQQVLVLLSQLAHNLIRWLSRWMLEALETQKQMEAQAQQMGRQPWDEIDSSAALPSTIQQTMQSIEQRGIKRWVRQIFAFGGQVTIKRGIVKCLTFNPAYPLIDRFVLAFEALLRPYGVRVCVGKT